MNLLLKKIIIAVGLIAAPFGMYADQNMSKVSTMDEMSQEEQQQRMEMMLMTKMVAEVMKDLIASNKMTVDWLLQNYSKEEQKSMEKIMQVVQVHLKNRGNVLLGSLADEFGITDLKEKKEFVANAMTWLAQVIPSEFQKWVYFSAHAGLIRRK